MYNILFLVNCYQIYYTFFTLIITHLRKSIYKSIFVCVTLMYFNDFSNIDAGDEKLFSTLENSLFQAISADTVEWRRSFSRPIKQVKLGATFLPFSKDILPTEKDWHLIKQPIFHIYWTECSVSKLIL